MTHIYSVRETRRPDNPMEGTVTHGEVKYSAGQPGAAKRDFDLERSAAALTFDVPVEKLSPRSPDTTSEGASSEVTLGLRAFRLSSALCNLATVGFDKTINRWQTTGEPTEIALRAFAHRFSLGKKTLVSAGWKEGRRVSV